jgi:hypothetical protein
MHCLTVCVAQTWTNAEVSKGIGSPNKMHIISLELIQWFKLFEKLHLRTFWQFVSLRIKFHYQACNILVRIMKLLSLHV